jgi:hypothetical protein
MSTRPIWHKSWQAWPDGTSYYNNIFYNLGSGNYDFGSSTGNVFAYNVFHGNHPSREPGDPYKSTRDPRLVEPGNPDTSINTVAGYQLRADSPCIDTGKTLPDNGGWDYWGNPIPSGDGATDRGAYEYVK